MEFSTDSYYNYSSAQYSIYNTGASGFNGFIFFPMEIENRTSKKSR